MIDRPNAHGQTRRAAGGMMRAALGGAVGVVVLIVLHLRWGGPSLSLGLQSLKRVSSGRKFCATPAGR
jgi:hypothetical protein